MQLHGLRRAGWTAKLANAVPGGACHYTKKWILLSRLYVRAASAAELDDTILHEIAHALVGPHHHHDAVWRAKARAIGCSGDRCHTVQFSPPRWIVACAAGCFTRTAHRRRRRAVCRRCGGQVTWRPWNGEPAHELAGRNERPASQEKAVSGGEEMAAAVPDGGPSEQGVFDFAMG